MYRKKMKLLAYHLTFLSLFLVILFPNSGTANEKQVFPARIKSIYKHPPLHFTQGLIESNGTLYESTGQYGESAIYTLNKATGKSQKLVALSEDFFGEGITILDNRLYQLTWKSEQVFVYDLPDFQPVQQRQIEGQGWGITHNSTALIISDGTSTLRFFDPVSFEEIKQLTVRFNGLKLSSLNELELVNSTLFANIWHLDKVAAINPENGEVQYLIDLRSLRPSLHSGAGVANGIATLDNGTTLLVTGKLWDKMFEINYPTPKKDINSKH